MNSSTTLSFVKKESLIKERADQMSKSSLHGYQELLDVATKELGFGQSYRQFQNAKKEEEKLYLPSEIMFVGKQIVVRDFELETSFCYGPHKDMTELLTRHYPDVKQVYVQMGDSIPKIIETEEEFNQTYAKDCQEVKIDVNSDNGNPFDFVAVTTHKKLLTSEVVDAMVKAIAVKRIYQQIDDYEVLATNKKQETYRFVNLGVEFPWVPNLKQMYQMVGKSTTPITDKNLASALWENTKKDLLAVTKSGALLSHEILEAMKNEHDRKKSVNKNLISLLLRRQNCQTLEQLKHFLLKAYNMHWSKRKNLVWELKFKQYTVKFDVEAKQRMNASSLTRFDFAVAFCVIQRSLSLSKHSNVLFVRLFDTAAKKKYFMTEVQKDLTIKDNREICLMTKEEFEFHKPTMLELGYEINVVHFE